MTWSLEKSMTLDKKKNTILIVLVTEKETRMAMKNIFEKHRNLPMSYTLNTLTTKQGKYPFGYQTQ